MQGIKTYLEVIGTHSEETLPSVMITSNDTCRLLFNVGEGIVRSGIEHGARTAKAHLFITELSSDALSDFSGYTLRTHGAGNRNTHWYGPPNLANVIFANRFFFSRKHTIVLTECEGGEKIEKDGNIIEPIAIKLPYVTSDIEERISRVVPYPLEQQENPLHIDPKSLIKRVKSMPFPDFIHWMKGRGGLIDGYHHIEREMLQQYLTKYPHVDNGDAVIPPDFFVPEDPNQLNVSSRHFIMELHSSRVGSESKESIDNRMRGRIADYSREPIFGPSKSLRYPFFMKYVMALIRPRHAIPKPANVYTILNYLVRTPEIKGTLDAKKAQALGVPKGPALGALQKGGSYTTPDGKVIKSEDVMSPSFPGPIISIVSCPSIAVAELLAVHPRWKELKDGGESIACMVHYSPREVVDTPTYKQFLDNFGPACQHIFLGKGLCRNQPIFRTSANQTCLLNMLSPRWFPQPFLDDFVPNLPEGLPPKSVQGDLFMKYLAVPLAKAGIHTAECLPKFDVAAIQKEFTKKNAPVAPDAGVVEKLQDMKISDKELEIVFFGTGCSAASKHRNETGIFLNFFEKGGLMMDVGSGTYGQMYRKYGPATTKILSKLKVIWISHTHADHIQGIVRLLHMHHLAVMEESNGKSDDKVLVIGPHTLYDVLLEHAQTCVSLMPLFFEFQKYFFDETQACSCKYKNEAHHEFAFDFVDSFDLRTPSTLLKDSLGIEMVISIPVFHSFMSHALGLKHVNGWSVVFSGDTSYCQRLIDSFSTPTVLIHEASFEDNLEEKAHAKSHCTISQAVDTGKKMNAGSTILTHFSQRYPRNLSIAPQHSNSNVAPAFDFMTVNLAHNHILSSCPAEIGDRLVPLLGDVEEDEYVDVD